MDLFYIDRRLAKRWPGESADGPSAAAVTAILEHRTLPDGMPVMLDAAMRPIEPLCSWFRHMAYEGLRPETMQTYAQIVRRLVEFLSRRGIDVFSATEADLVAFHSARTETQAAPIGEVTWDKDRAAIKKLYRWLKDERYVRQLPYLARSHRGPMGTAMHREPKIRHMELEQYTYFRDVGLGGLLPAGQVDPAFRGWAPHRGRAALELALMSGMRLQEWSTMLLPELGVGARRPGEGVEFTLERCAKYGLMRRVWVPSAALDAVDMFLLLERPQMVEKAQRSLKAHAPDLFMVERVDADRGRLYGIYDGRRREWQIEALTPQMRHIAVMEGEFGLEPLAVFIGHGGRMLGPSRWDGVR
ncbi:MAG TPA: site-specific integrase, partial [Actinocrinis sp.]|uniref:site-specific integrase n=1 Tax=Actinocrinis sp. TaxID=1920516 RepID=UPI002D4CB480